MGVDVDDVVVLVVDCVVVVLVVVDVDDVVVLVVVSVVVVVVLDDVVVD